MGELNNSSKFFKTDNSVDLQLTKNDKILTMINQLFDENKELMERLKNK
ncbi:hypothetical protein [Limosilactobacillus reuteri]|nr:hypothetical protein [Limosilactobacillus reuteri]MCC4358891.1 hypothetical protein [Limosilactobacillus reuteri]MCC4362897.1 hypothetical protein [Limosilactobacillus reuteri]MCC4364918.1 hypothetical protein [Limosilactobacillus reuteri]